MAQPTPVVLPRDPLVDLIRRAEEGCQQSAHAVFELCRLPLLKVIRKVMHRRVRTLFDSDDFLLDAFQQIFTHHFQHDILQSPHRLWAYLKKIAENKVRDAQRKYLVSERSNLRNEIFLEDTRIDDDFSSDEMDPFDRLVLKELVEERLAQMVSQLPQTLQTIVGRLLEGWTAGEIALSLGVETKRVYRAMDWLRKKIMEKE